MKNDTDILLGDHTDNVQIITTEPLRECYGGGAWEAIKDPATSVENLKNALRILEEKNEPRTKRKIEKIKKKSKVGKTSRSVKKKRYGGTLFEVKRKGENLYTDGMK